MEESIAKYLEENLVVELEDAHLKVYVLSENYYGRRDIAEIDLAPMIAEVVQEVLDSQ